MLKICVVLSGCGVFDGSEIHEATAALLAFDRLGAEAFCAAPDIDQYHTIDHVTGQETVDVRGVLAESARIARGKIRPLSEIHAKDIDALFFPGGFGAAKNLSSYANAGTMCSIDPQVERIITEMHAARKPIGAVCIAPVVLAKAFEGTGVSPKMTIGTDSKTAGDIAGMGARHENRTVLEVCTDEENLIVTGPAYMLAKRISEVFDGVANVCAEVVRLAQQQKERHATG
ncbi:MAG: isoprenoid biosynthesis glyoxalase ElbB [bacterium]|jgi:enhancing lycopene biosynthesis protein 2